MEIEEIREEIKENTFKYMRTVAMDIIVVVVALAYVFYRMVDFEATNANPWILIAESAMSIFCAVVIKQALGENGFIKGYNSQIWREEEDKYNACCATANPYMDRTSGYYAQLRKEKKEEFRRSHMQSAPLKYAQWFDNEGDYIGKAEDYKQLNHRQKRILNRCISVKIHIPNMFSQLAKNSERYTRREPTDRGQRAKSATKNTLSAVVISAISVYFIPMLSGWNWAYFIVATVQVSLWIMFGMLQRYDNYNFVTHDKVDVLKDKKEQIIRFVSECERGLYAPQIEEKCNN